MTVLMASVILVMYFEKHSGTAIGIKHSGGAMSALVFPYILLHLKEGYGIRGTILVFGGIVLHLTVLCQLLREPIWARRRITPPVLPNKPVTIVSGSCAGQNRPEATAPSQDSVCETIHETASLFCRPAFYGILTAFLLLDFSKTTVAATIIDYGEDKGFSLRDAESVITYSAPTEIAGFVLLPMLADRQYFDRTYLTVISFILLGVVTALVPECASYGSFTVVFLFLKLLQACVTTMRVILIVDYFGTEKLPTCWGIAGLFSVPLFLLNPSIIGA